MAEFADRFQHLFSVFDRSLLLWQKNGIRNKKSYIRADGSSHEMAGQRLFMQRCHTEVWVWEVANFQDQVQEKYF